MMRLSRTWKREDLLAGGVHVMTAVFTPEATRVGMEPCETKPLTELRGWETRRWGSLGGCTEGGGQGGGGGCYGATAIAGRRRVDAGGDEGKRRDVSEGLV